MYEDDFESNGETQEEPKRQFKISDRILNLSPDRRQRMVNLAIWASREKFFKRQRQQLKNFIASLKNNLKKSDLEFSKIYILEEEIATTQKIIDDIEKEMALELSGIPIWEHFLKNIKGMGEATAAIFIAKIGDIGRFYSISALRKFSGWYPQNGQAVKRRRGAEDDTNKFNQDLHQALYQWTESIRKAKEDHYGRLWNQFKEKIKEKHPEWEGRKATKGKKIEGIPMHIDRMARRKVIQIFLSDLFCIWRDVEGLEQTKPYAVDILGHNGFMDPLKNPYYKKPAGA